MFHNPISLSSQRSSLTTLSKKFNCFRTKQCKSITPLILIGPQKSLQCCLNGANDNKESCSRKSAQKWEINAERECSQCFK